MPSEDTKISEFDQYRKSDKKSSLIYVDLESLFKRIDGCKSNSGKSSSTKLCEHIPFSYSVSTIWTFEGIEKKEDVYRGKECIKNCESLRDPALKITKFQKKKMMSSTNEHQEPYE